MNPKRPFGLISSTSLVIGNMIGSGIFLLPASLAAIGSISLAGWIITTIGSILLAVIFGKLSQRLPLTGGLYAYARHELGRSVGIQTSVLYILGNIIGDAATVVALLAYLTVFWPAINSNHLLSFSVGAAVIWFIAGLNIIGIKEVKIVQVVTTVIKLIPIIIVSFVGLFHVHLTHLSHLNITSHSNLVAIANAAMLTFFAFAGLESATIPAENIEKPEVNIFRASVWGTILTAIIYILSTTALMGMFAPDVLAKDPAPFASAGKVIFGYFTNQTFAIAAIIACFSTVMGFLFITTQTIMATARDGLLPRFLSRVTRQNTPYWAIIVSSIIMTALLSMNYSKLLTSQFTLLITLSNFCVLIPYLYASIAAIKMFKREKLFGAIFMGMIACAYIIFALVGSFYS